MNKQLTAIGIIGILIVISISGCLENKEGNGSIITPLSGKVTVTTNKSEYGPNETIDITLYNGLNVSIFYYNYSNVYGFEKRSLNGWQSLIIFNPYIFIEFVPWSPPDNELKPGESVKFEWNPEIWTNDSYAPKEPEPGIYRLVTDIWQKDNLSQNWTWQTVYSNEFTIKEENTSYETFTVYRGFQEEPYNITVYNVSVPLNESEAIKVFVEVTGWKSDYRFIHVNETGKDLVVRALEVPMGGEYTTIINQENRTINAFYINI